MQSKNTVTNEEKITLMLNSFKKGDLSLGQFAKALNKNHEEAMKLLSLMGIDVIDYDFQDEIKFLDDFLSKN